MKDLLFTKNYIIKSKKRILRNSEIAVYYERLSQDFDEYALVEKANRVANCLKYIDCDYYRFQGVKDVKRVNACGDIFCNNCQNRLGNKRFNKYAPFLTKLSDVFDLYHITFTIPNVNSYELKGALEKMYKKFPYIIRYFKGIQKAKGFDFSQFGFVGAVRNLEITVKNKNGKTEYHPHFHCIFLLRKDLDMSGVNYNVYSYKRNKNEVTAFSDFEIFLQKFWKLIYTGKKFTKENFESFDLGYSCIAQKASKEDIKEVFKYTVEGIFKDDFELSYNIFATLYNALHRRKIIQGYGILNKFKFDVNSDDDKIDRYIKVVEDLNTVEKPIFHVMKFDNVLSEMESGIRFISKYRKDE